MDYKEHITTEGQCWDQIAKIYYNDEKLMTVIIQANPEYRAYSRLPGNIAIKIPILDNKKLTNQQLPIWKR